VTNQYTLHTIRNSSSWISKKHLQNVFRHLNTRPRNFKTRERKEREREHKKRTIHQKYTFVIYR